MTQEDLDRESNRLARLYLGKDWQELSEDDQDVLTGLIRLDVEVSAAYIAWCEGVIDGGVSPEWRF